MSTRMWSTLPRERVSAASASGNAGRPAFMNRLPDSDTTPSRDARRASHDAPAVARAGCAGSSPAAGSASSSSRYGVDLAMAVGVVAERDHVDAGREQLARDLRGDPEAAGGVLAVDDDEVGRVALAQRRQQRQQRALAEPADDVADEQDADGFAHVLSALILPAACALRFPRRPGAHRTARAPPAAKSPRIARRRRTPNGPSDGDRDAGDDAAHPAPASPVAAGRRPALDPAGDAAARAARPVGAGARGRHGAADPARREHDRADPQPAGRGCS